MSLIERLESLVRGLQTLRTKISIGVLFLRRISIEFVHFVSCAKAL